LHLRVCWADYHRLLESLCSWPCNGQMISVHHVLLPTSIQVFNVGSIAKDMLQLYFENSRRSGGGEIKHFTMNERHGYAIIEFHEPHGHYFISLYQLVQQYEFNTKRCHWVENNDAGYYWGDLESVLFVNHWPLCRKVNSNEYHMHIVLDDMTFSVLFYILLML